MLCLANLNLCGKPQHTQHTLEREDLTLAQIQAIMPSVVLGGVAAPEEPKPWHLSSRLLVLQCQNKAKLRHHLMEKCKIKHEG